MALSQVELKRLRLQIAAAVNKKVIELQAEGKKPYLDPPQVNEMFVSQGIRYIHWRTEHGVQSCIVGVHPWVEHLATERVPLNPEEQAYGEQIADRLKI